jgi:ethanolamine utilization protein EutN
MRIGKVIGQLTLSRCHSALIGAQWKVVVPVTEDDLRTEREPKTEELVVYDNLSAGEGQQIAFSEGAEASMPFFPNPKPVDAYNAAILDVIELT